MKRHGLFVEGVEPNIDAWRYSIERFDLSVSNAFLEDVIPLERQFEWAYLGEVLEHIPDPVKFLDLVREQLTSDGVVTIVVPNDFNPLQLAYSAISGCDPWWVSPLHHLNYFNKVGLTNCLDSAGFEVIHSETTFPLELFLLMGDEYVGNDLVGRSIQSKRKRFEMNLFESHVDTYSAFVGSLASAGIGRELVVYARVR
jgi:SAM-dependent methyltransferase